MNTMTAGFLQNALTVVVNLKTSMDVSVRRQHQPMSISIFYLGFEPCHCG